jgi:uroporphyrinogen decarboxylase
MIRKSLLDVLEGRKPSRRPVWFMRQAGRYLPEYREIRNKAGSFLDLCYQPELAAEVTLQPLRRYDLDAAIVFSDILVVPHAMGLDLRFEEGEGPLVGTVGTMAEVKALRPVAGTAQVNAVGETLGRVKEGLPKGVGLIGFCGGPWTVASYMVEGRSSDRRRAKLAAFNGEPWFAALIDRLVEESIAYLEVQAKAGAEVVQIFDSWAGELSGRARQRFIVEPLRRLVESFRARCPTVPVIVFARGLGVDHLKIAEIDGVAAIGVETETPLDWLAGAVKGACAVQGNLDPVALLSGKTALRGAAADVARSVSMERHIFNLGHGITPETPPKALAIVLAAVRDFDSGGGT